MSSNRLLHIDGLKGICAIIVVLNHIHFAFLGYSPVASMIDKIPVLRLATNGGLAVRIFIGISAMIMYQKAMTGSIESIAKVLRKRYFRLTIPIAATLLLAAVLKALGFFHHEELGQALGVNWLQIDVQHYSQLPKAILLTVISNNYRWINPMWMMMYIFWGTVFSVSLGLAHRQCQRWKIALNFVLFLAIAHFYNVNYVAIVVGCMLAHYKPSCTDWIRRLVLMMATALFLYTAIFRIPVVHKILLSSTLLFVCLNSCFIKRILSCKPLVWLGSISFELYMLHALVIYTLGCSTYMALPNGNGKILGVTIVILGGSLLAAWLYNRYLTPWLNRLTDVVS